MKKIYKSIFVLTMSLFLTMGLGASTTKAESQDEEFKLGVEVLLEEKKDLIEGKNVGLITNPTGVDSNLDSIVDLLHEDEDVELAAMYGPEHGVRGDAQAGGQVESYVDEQTGVIVHSLYGATRKPTPEMLEGIDTLIFDIQDVGARFYTYIYTMALAMEAAEEQGIDMIVLDRPNPLGGNLVDGPILEEEFSSFVGKYPIPVMHGMTVGELAYYFNDQFDINSNLTIVPMENWDRDMLYDDTGLELVSPSPNMPTTDTVMVYPGAGFFEGTNLSEGRGTTKPFELIGAPFISAYDYAKELNELELPGVKFRAASFTPIQSKHEGTLVHGVQIHVLNPRTYEPIQTGLEMIIKLQEMYPEEFELTSWFDTLIGNDWIREDILAGNSYEQISGKWQEGLNGFKEGRKPYLIYENGLDLSEVDELIEKGLNLNESLYTEESVTLFEESFIPLVNMRDDILNEFSKNKLLENLDAVFDLLEETGTSEDSEAVEKVSNLLATLPTKGKVVLEDKEAIEAGRRAYDALAAAQQDLVVYYAKDRLKNAEAELVILEDSDLTAAKPVADQLASLPTKGKVQLKDKEAIEAGRTAHDELTDAQQTELVDKWGYTVNRLTNAEMELEKLEK